MIKALIERTSLSAMRWRNRLRSCVQHFRYKGRSAEEVFTIIYNRNQWGDTESKSGTGSNKKNTQLTVQIVSKVMTDLKITSLLDIPCGDFNWMQQVQFNGAQYIGADIVAELVSHNSERYANEATRFEKLDIMTSALPRVDLIFCRDCLVHFSNSDIAKALRNIRASGSTYLMATTFPAHRNHDIATGNWRPINLEAAPFALPPPLMIQSELHDEGAGYRDKSLAVWRISDL